MPNKAWNMGVDMIPSTTNNFNLGTTQKKWVVNGYTLNDACGKSVDTSLTDETTSTNVPSSSAVVGYVKGKEVNVSVSSEALVITTGSTEQGA